MVGNKHIKHIKRYSINSLVYYPDKKKSRPSDSINIKKKADGLLSYDEKLSKYP